MARFPRTVLPTVHHRWPSLRPQTGGVKMERLLTVMVLCVFASFAHADEQNAIQPPQGVEICKEPLSDNCKAFGDRINQRTPEKQKAFDVEQLSSLVQRCQHFLSETQRMRMRISPNESQAATKILSESNGLSNRRRIILSLSSPASCTIAI